MNVKLKSQLVRINAEAISVIKEMSRDGAFTAAVKLGCNKEILHFISEMSELEILEVASNYAQQDSMFSLATFDKKSFNKTEAVESFFENTFLAN